MLFTKKICITLCLLFLISAASFASAGFGFSREMPVVRITWDEKFSSEAGISLYSAYDKGVLSDMKFGLSLTPAMYRVFEWEFLRLYGSINIYAELNYTDTASNPKFLRVHQYSLKIIFPDIEIAVPYVKGLYATAAAGLAMDWAFDAKGVSTGVKAGIFAPSFYTLGLVYYFPDGDTAGEEVAE